MIIKAIKVVYSFVHPVFTECLQNKNLICKLGTNWGKSWLTYAFLYAKYGGLKEE